MPELQWALSPTISFDGERFEIYQTFPKEKAFIRLWAESPLELTTILHAIGTKRLFPRVETMEEFLARGGVVIHCPPRYAVANTSGTRPKQKRHINITLEELLGEE